MVVAVAAEDGGLVVVVVAVVVAAVVVVAAAAAAAAVEEREQGEGTMVVDGGSANDWVSDEEIAVEMAGENERHLRYGEDAAEE